MEATTPEAEATTVVTTMEAEATIEVVDGMAVAGAGTIMAGTIEEVGVRVGVVVVGKGQLIS